MRSEWKQWPDPMRISWPVRGGMAHVEYQMFGGEGVRNDDGSWSPREFTYVEMPSDVTAPYFVMECEYSLQDLVPRIMAFHAIQREPSREVRSTDLRYVHLEDALEQAWLHVTNRGVAVVEDAASPVELMSLESMERDKRKTLRGLRSQNRRKITPGVNQEVARIWLADTTGAPTKAVADHYGLAPSTASLYVKRARQAGLLPPPARTAKPARATASAPRSAARTKTQTRSPKR